MNRIQVVRVLALAGAWVLLPPAGGCDKDDAPANPPPVTPTPPAPNNTPKAGGSGGTSDAAAATPGSAAEPDSAAQGPGAGDPTVTTTPAGRKSAAADDTAKERQATEHLAAATKHLKDKKPDLARESLEQAEAMQESLPKPLREQIKTMRVTVDNFARTESIAPLDEENK